MLCCAVLRWFRALFCDAYNAAYACCAKLGHNDVRSERSTHSDTRRSETISPGEVTILFTLTVAIDMTKMVSSSAPAFPASNLPTRVVSRFCWSTGKSFDGVGIDLFPYNLIFKSRLQIIIEYVKSVWWEKQWVELGSTFIDGRNLIETESDYNTKRIYKLLVYSAKQNCK